MSQISFTPFEKLLLGSKNQQGIAITFILAWLARTDGVVDAEEVALLRKVASQSIQKESIDSLLQIAAHPNSDDLQLACELIQRSVQGESRDRFIELVLGMALADGVLSTTENHVVRFLADILGIGEQGINQAFSRIMGDGKVLPKPSNVSSAEWWKGREGGDQRSSDNNERYKRPNDRTKQATAPSASMKRLKALAALGLDEDATAEEIRKAFRRMAQVHHPDRYASLGKEAVQAATESFRRIKSAYDYLT